jgi:hypothetical protein
MKNIALILSIVCALLVVFGTILALGGNHIGDYSIAIGSIGAVFALRKLDKGLSNK